VIKPQFARGLKQIGEARFGRLALIIEMADG
jgi:hypothetical protein